jgi:hypothetical protein
MQKTMMPIKKSAGCKAAVPLWNSCSNYDLLLYYFDTDRDVVPVFAVLREGINAAYYSYRMVSKLHNGL